MQYVPTRTNVDTIIEPAFGLPVGKLSLAVATRDGEGALTKWLDKVRQNVSCAFIGPQDPYISKSAVPMNCLGDRLHDVLLDESRPRLVITCLPVDSDQYGHIWLDDVLTLLSSSPGHARRPYPDVAWLVYTTEEVLSGSPARKPFQVSSTLTLLFDIGPFDVDDNMDRTMPYVRVQKSAISATQGYVTTLDF